MEDNGIDLRGVFGLLRRQIRLIAITFFAVIAVATFIAFSLTPVFTSTALVLVDPTRKNLLDPDAQMSSGSSDSPRIDSEVEILRSDTILLRVIQQQNLAGIENANFSPSLRERIMVSLNLMEPTQPTAEDALNLALNALRGSVAIQRRGLTYLISVQARSPDPQKAANLANAVTEAYIADQLESKVASTLASRDILQARINAAREAIVSSEDAFDTFINDNIDRISSDTGRTDLAALQNQIDDLVAQRDENSRLANTVQADIASSNWQQVVNSLQSETLADLERQRTELAGRLAANGGSPVAVDLQAELSEIEGRLREEASTEVTGLLQSVTSSQAEEGELRQTLRAGVLGSGISADILTRIYELRQNADLARRQYELLLSRTQELEAQANLQVADSRIVSAALAPQFPSFPNRTLIVAVAGVVGLGLGIALAFLYENFIGGFITEAQMSSVLRTRVATAVPRQRAKSEKESIANLMVTAPLSVFAESVRRLRATLEQTLNASGHQPSDAAGKVVLITSTAPNEGKTTIALALARAYAMSGQKVLLIDCDLRKPSLHRHLNIDPSHGLQDYLNKETDSIAPILSKDELTSATFIVGARRSNLPTDQFLTGPHFAKLLDAARKSFQVVLIDTSPVGPVVDCLYVAPHADAIVFISRWSSTSQQDARNSMQALQQAKRPGTEIFAVINQQDQNRASYMRKYGGYYAEVSY